MKKISFPLSLVFSAILLFTCSVFIHAADGPGVYGGGSFYYNRDYSINELKGSGFEWVCVWTIHMYPNGDLTFNGEFPIVTNGTYVGDATYPEFINDMALLKTAPTSINWVEFGLSGWGSETFDNIKTLVNSEGTGPNSKLYKSFNALRQAIPSIDAISFDDEKTYDAASATQFAVMLADIGFKVSVCPYTQASFWQSVVANTNSQRPGTIEDVHLQCYAGGASNNPCTWDGYFASDINVMPGVEDGSSIGSQMANWNNQCGIAGGFIWLYDDFKNNPSLTQSYAAAINNNITLPSTTAPDPATSPTPINGSTGVNTSTTLSWVKGNGASSHVVYFGTDPTPDNGENQGSQSGTTYNPGTLALNTTYYWRIDEVNSIGTTTGSIWSFTTEATTTSNLAPTATITVSSEYQNTNWSKEKLVDGITGQDGNGEWASGGETTPWAQLTWNSAVDINKVVLFDRPSSAEIISNGTLSFSDGSTISTGALPNDGSAKEFTFANKTVTWVRFTVTIGSGPNVGMAEFQVFGTASTPSQSPYQGITASIPGTIEAENFDNGGEGVAYHDVDASNRGPNVMRENEGVDIESRDGGNSVGWIADGEWLEYTVNATAGTYDIEARVATPSNGKSIVVKLDGAILGTFNVPNTTNWGVFQTITLSGINISGGNDKVLRLEFVGGYVNLNWVKFNSVTGGTTLNLGNSSVSDGPFHDSWSSIMIINEADTYTNTSGSQETININSFNFYTYQKSDPVTPFVVRVNGNNNFTVLAIGTTRASSGYNIGNNAVDFKSGGSSITINNNEKIAVGFLDANANGTGSGSGSVIPFDENSPDQIWLTGSPGSSSGSVSVGSAPTAGPNSYTTLNRNYHFNIEMAVSAFKNADDESFKTFGSNFMIYPNPVKDVLHIQLDGKVEDGTSLKVYNASGVMVKSALILDNTHQIEISDLEAGLYFMMLQRNGQIETKKFIKQ